MSTHIKPLTKQRQTVVYYLNAGITGLVIASLGPSIPLYADSTGLELSNLGILFTALFSGLLTGSIWAAHLFTIKPAHRIMALSLLGVSFMVSYLPFINDLKGLVVSWFLLGLFFGLIEVGMNTLILWVHAEKSTPFVSIMHFLFGVGALLAPAFIGLSLEYSNDFNSAYWAIAGLTILAALYTVQVSEPQPPDNKPAPGNMLKPPALVMFATLLLFLYVAAEVSFSGWLTSYAMQSPDITSSNAVYVTSVFWATLALGRLSGIFLARHISTGMILALSISGCFISAALLAILGSNTLFLLIGVVMMGLSMACIFPMIFLFMEQRILVTGAVSSWCLIGASLGGMIVPFGIGFLFT